MRVFVTGVAGFIGSHVADHLVELGHEVAGIDDLSGGQREHVPSGVEFWNLSCNDSLESVFEKFQPQAVIHLAAYAAEGLSHHIATFNYQSNLVATANVLNAAHRFGVQHFVFSSSIAAYGHPSTDRPFDESTPCQPCDPYGIAKLACEQHIAAFHDYFGGPTYTIFRPHNVFGSRQNISDPYRNVVGIFFRCAMQGQPFPVFGDGLQTRSFSYVDVVANSIARSIETPAAQNETFNIGGDESLTILELGKRIATVIGIQPEFEFQPARQEVKHAHADHTKAKTVFRETHQQAVTIDEGLRRMAQYIKSHDIPPPTPCPSKIEIAHKLPPSWRDSQ